MPTYYCWPNVTDDPGGVAEVLRAHAEHLPKYGWHEVSTEAEADLVVGHLGTESKRLDVFHLHGLYPTAELEYSQPFWTMNQEIIENIRRARHTIAVSDWVAQCLRRELHLDPWVLSHGVDVDTWANLPKGEFDIRPYALWNKTRRFGVCDPSPVIHLARKFPTYRFVTTFLPPKYDGAPLPNVRVTGLLPRAQSRHIIRDAEVYLATTKETFGIGVLEAMAAGCAIVGYRWGSVPGILGDTGILVPPGDTDALAEAMSEVVINHDDYSQRAQTRAREFAWDSACARLAKHYDTALAGLTPSSPRVSVIIPCWNYSKYITQAIQSVYSQTYQDWELIIVDDGSTDDSSKIIQEFIQNEPRARLIHQVNSGVAHARNHGISQARGEYICCLDADDELASDYLEIVIPALIRDPKLGIAYTGITIMNEDGTLSDHVHSWPGPYDIHRGVSGNQVPTCCVYRKSWWTRLGGYRQRFAPHGAGQEDGDFWFRILANGGSAEMVSPKGLFHYRLHPGQATNIHRGDWSKNTYHPWYPFIQDCAHPLASQLAEAARKSWPVHDYDLPGVSVIIPVGPGHQDVLVDALDSVEAQTYRNWEVVVVNDTGAPLDITPWPHARLVDTQGSKGAGFARNRGTETAKAPLLVYLDADDFLQPSFLTRTIETWVDNQDRWVYTDTVILHPDGRLEDYPVPDWDVRRLWRRGLAGVTSLHTKESWELVNGFDEESTREDWDFHLRLARAGICGIHIPESLYTYRHSTGKRRGEGTHKREILTIHETYNQEELAMACKDCGAKKIRRRKMDDIKVESKNWSAKTDSGFVRLEYIGKNKNELTFKGPTGRRYRFGNNEYHRTGLVHPDDVHWALRLNCFREANQPPPSTESAPLHAEPSPKPSPVSTSALTSTPKDDTLVPGSAGLDLAVGTHSIQELQNMDLTKYDLVTAIRLEVAGKNRKSALVLLGRAQRRLERERRRASSPGDLIEETHEITEETHGETFSETTEDESDVSEDTPEDTPEEKSPDLSEDTLEMSTETNWTWDKREQEYTENTSSE